MSQLSIFPTEEQSQVSQLCYVNLLFNLRVKEIKQLGYSVLIRTKNGRNIITWTTKDHWASASYNDSSVKDLTLVIERIIETIVSFLSVKTSK